MSEAKPRLLPDGDTEQQIASQTERMVFATLLLHLEELFPAFSIEVFRNTCLQCADERLALEVDKKTAFAESAARIRRATIMAMIPPASDAEPPAGQP